MPAWVPIIQRIQEQVSGLVKASLDLLFPPRCGGCGRSGSLLCEECLAAFTPLTGPLCEVCGEMVSAPGLCWRCTAERPRFDYVASAFVYEGALRHTIHALKYRGQKALAGPLAEALAAHVNSPDGRAGTAPILCPVPMHPDRLHERGYNHAGLLADRLAVLWGLERLPDEALRRTRHTPRQVGQDYQARRENVLGAFEATPALVAGRSVLLVDDVCTTGATLNACAVALLQASAAAAACVTVARAQTRAGEGAPGLR